MTCPRLSGGVSYSPNPKTRVAVKTPSAVGFAVVNKVAGGSVTTFNGAMRETQERRER